jgi:predicted TIM-barrel fold metal-dependent hydrolase
MTIHVDCQSHVFPEKYAEILTRNNGLVRTLKKDDGYLISYYGGMQTFQLKLGDYHPGKKVRDMDEAGIDVSVLSINIPGPELLTPDLGVEGARVCNDYLHELCGRYPGRFVGLAALPLQDIESALEEFDRAVQKLHMRGVLLPSHVGGKPVDSPGLAPLFARAERERIPLVLHPTVPTWGEVLKDYSMIPMMGLMVETSIAMLRLILSGLLERYPGLILVHPHCGGILPYLMPRIEEQTEVKRRGREHISQPPSEYYRKVYLDMVSPSKQAMEYVYQFSSPDHLLFGSDHPWVKIQTLRGYFESLPIPDAAKEMILGGNACRIFRIQSPSSK